MDSDNQFPYLIRDLTTDDLDQYNDLLRYAFQVTEQEIINAGWRDDEIKQSKFPVLERADILGCYDGDTLVSQFAVYPLHMNVYNADYPIGFITSVSTYPEYTGKGIMARLMKKSLYRKFGWEIISNKISYVVKDRQIPTKMKAPGLVHRVDWENKDFMELHTKFARQTHGCLYRDELH